MACSILDKTALPTINQLDSNVCVPDVCLFVWSGKLKDAEEMKKNKIETDYENASTTTRGLTASTLLGACGGPGGGLFVDCSVSISTNNGKSDDRLLPSTGSSTESSSLRFSLVAGGFAVMKTVAERMVAAAGTEMVLRRNTKDGSPASTAGVLAHTGSALHSAAAMAVKKD